MRVVLSPIFSELKEYIQRSLVDHSIGGRCGNLHAIDVVSSSVAIRKGERLRSQSFLGYVPLVTIVTYFLNRLVGLTRCLLN